MRDELPPPGRAWPGLLAACGLLLFGFVAGGLAVPRSAAPGQPDEPGSLVQALVPAPAEARGVDTAVPRRTAGRRRHARRLRPAGAAAVRRARDGVRLRGGSRPHPEGSSPRRRRGPPRPR